jgi:endonuclease/exonuclease/phosphatase family metal-dependent hydrolase
MAGKFLRKLTKRFFIYITAVVCFIFLLSCLAPYLNPAKWWFIGFLGLGVPYIVTLLVFGIIFWLIFKPRWALLPFICLLIGWKQLSVLIATHYHDSFAHEKTDSTIRIIDWNVGSMYGLSENTDKRKHNRTEIAGAVIKLEPDIICLQEFNHSYTQGHDADNIGLFKKDYPYYVYSKDYDKRNGFYTSGSVIFSKYPIVDSGKINYPGNIAESMIYADILLDADTIRIYTFHLQSFQFSPEDYSDMEKIAGQDEETLKASQNIFSKMKQAFTRRGIQAEIVRKETDKSPYPSIICGDFNDVPNSYTYFHIRGNRKDAFLERDYGIGRSYIALAPTLRIDYILPDTSFNVLQFDMVDEDLSDHIMLVSDVSLKK